MVKRNEPKPKPNRPTDPNQLAKAIVDEATQAQETEVRDDQVFGGCRKHPNRGDNHGPPAPADK